jgi:hypothetical protein
MPRPKTPEKTTISKSEFVRSQPATLSATEVLAKAKAAGLKLTAQVIYKARSSAKPRVKANADASTKSSAVPKPTTTKAAFVRNLPATVPVKVIVAQAKAAGMKLSANYVYLIRRAAKANRSSARAARSVPWPITTMLSAENLLKAVAAEIGLGRSIELLHDERGWVHSITRS